MVKLIGLTLVVFASVLVSSGWTNTVDPFEQFNVYSVNNIGSPRSAYGSDFQGVAGAGGDVYFSRFTLMGKDSTDGYVLHAGGSATLNGGSYLGSLDVGKNLTVQSLNINRDVVLGGDMMAHRGGSIKGDILAGGSARIPRQWHVGGGVKEGVDYVGLDYDSISNYFKSTSDAIASMKSTGKIDNQWGGLSFSAADGINILNISADDLKSAWGFSIKGSADSKVLINVTGVNAKLDSTNWKYLGGITPSDVILNFGEADRLKLSSSNNVNILAPFAETVFERGLITGSLIVNNLQGGGQVNLGHFDTGLMSIPEPAAIIILGMGGLWIRRAAKRRAIK